MTCRAIALVWLTAICFVAVPVAAQLPPPASAPASDPAAPLDSASVAAPDPTSSPPGPGPAPAPVAHSDPVASDSAPDPDPAPDSAPVSVPASSSPLTSDPDPAPLAAEEALGLNREQRRLIQRGLAAAGFDPGRPDGVFGDATRRAIQGWQADRGQASTGFLDVQAAEDLTLLGRQQRILEETQDERDEMQEQRDRADGERDIAEERADAAEERADAVRSNLEETEQQAAADRERYVLWLAVVVAAATAVALLMWVTSRRSVTKAQRERASAETLAQAAQSEVAQRDVRDRLANEVPGVFLDGTDADGRPIALRVPGRAIAAENGALIGRNPFDSTVVLDHPEVSRKHFRLVARGNTVLIEARKTMNGTKLNGDTLAPGASAPLDDGAVLHLGNLKLTVTLGNLTGSPFA